MYKRKTEKAFFSTKNILNCAVACSFILCNELFSTKNILNCAVACSFILYYVMNCLVLKIF